MTTTKTSSSQIAEGDRIYATEIVDYQFSENVRQIERGEEGTVAYLNESGRYDLWIEWDAGFCAMADSGSVALVD